MQHLWAPTQTDENCMNCLNGLHKLFPHCVNFVPHCWGWSGSVFDMVMQTIETRRDPCCLVFWKEEQVSVTQGQALAGLSGWDEKETVGSLWVQGECVCVCLCLGGVDQSEVVLATVVTAPNLLYQLPSVLTETVSSSKRNCHPPLYRLSWPVSSPSRSLLTASLSSDPMPVFLHAHLVCHTMEVPLLCWIPLPNPFVQVSFLSVICVNHITESVIVFKLSCHVSSKTRQLAFPASFSSFLLFQIWLWTLPPLWQSLISHSCQVQICHQDIAWEWVLLSLFTESFSCKATF